MRNSTTAPFLVDVYDFGTEHKRIKNVTCLTSEMKNLRALNMTALYEMNKAYQALHCSDCCLLDLDKQSAKTAAVCFNQHV